MKLSFHKTTCNIGKYFEHLEEPDITTDISQMVYSKAKKLEKGQGQTEVNMNKFAPTMRAEHHGNIEFRRHKNSIVNENEKDMIERRLTVREAGLKYLNEGDELTFEVENGEKGPAAVKLQKA